MRVDILTLFPEMFPGPLGASILKRGMQAGYVGVRLHQIREYTDDRHHTVDDYPYGGGAGMVMKAPPLFAAVEAVLGLPPGPPGLYRCSREGAPEVLVAPDAPGPVPAPPEDAGPAPAPPVILMSPAGRLLTQQVAAELAALPRLVLVCGHYEGVDERVREHLVTDEISIGDYVLTGGELAALVVVDTVARLVPGVLAEGSAADESHATGRLEYPHYTRPATFRGWDVPALLVSGHHARVAAWRQREALRRTWQRRPEMLTVRTLTPQEQAWLAELAAETAVPAPGEDMENG
ncbi:MAG TPA: tRNA (guanosine(37)-N1)-methyltransferase TrmD [Chloroflexia bacterium]|nr:tRNA (guanosine(37)-N1)-methyltransferase TrmD [Chloroflexia bacterium]